MVVISESQAQTIWVVRERIKGRYEDRYHARPYPGSELVYLETFKTRREISALQGRRIIPLIKGAIAEWHKVNARGKESK